MLNWLFPLPLKKLNPPASTVVLDRNEEILRVYLATDDMWRIRVASEDISATLQEAVLAYEDRYFRWHPGINPAALLRAAAANLSAGRVVQGGSTITMQIARLMAPKQRTYFNKLKEMFRALQLEWRFSKGELLTHYFNLAPYGGNIVGVGAASHLYFNKHPAQLSLGEAAILAAIPNSPNRYRPDLDPSGARRACTKVLDILAENDKISQNQYRAALSEPIPTKRFELPFLAPHLANLLVEENRGSQPLLSSIDKRLQLMAKNLLQSHLQPLAGSGIDNGAVVIIENDSQAVRALVGSNDFFDARNDGQVNGATAPRSPGSALKPFVYALGLEHGLISPQSLLKDVPVEYADYKPVNYDERYHGAVTVEEALIHSLNVPAVNLYARLGGNGVYSFLKEAGVSSLPQPKEHYGLSLILGGCEISLLELTNLYAGLANGGWFRPYQLLETRAPAEGKRLLSAGTCFILTEILSQLRRPELPSVWEASVNLPKVAWKTGTSYGHRDAWSIGYTPEYTIGVWVGNFDGKGAPALIGAEAAAPILFALCNALGEEIGSRWFVQPNEVEVRQVCTASGMPLSDYCATARNEPYLPGISPNAPCSVHKLLSIDKKTGFRLCSICRLGRDYEESIVAQWPPEIATWLARNGHPVQAIPEHFPGCSAIASGIGPTIRSPQHKSTFRIRPKVDLAYQQILLDASVSNDTQTVYWFVDGRLVYSGNPHQRVFIKPRRGKHSILCLDDAGRSSQVVISVQ